MNAAPAGILLAAGLSTRFGPAVSNNKLLYPFTGNKPMLLVSAEKLARVLPGSIVVINQDLLSPQSQLQANLHKLDLRIVINEQPERGMGSSIACAVRASSDATGWLIMLADMPYINEGTIRLLAGRLQHADSIVAPEYRQRRGHPVGFGQQYKDELWALNGSAGARDIINRHKDRVELVPVDDAGVITDIDTPGDLVTGLP
jgi:molybdenum cofactor cytidylyltransferase